MGQCQVLHEPRHCRRLGAVLAHELEPGGGVEKQVPHGDDSALCRRGSLHSAGHAALQAERSSLATGLTGADLHTAHSGDGRQSLAPEAQGADAPQVLPGAQLGGGVAQKGRGELSRGDAAAVVRHPDEAHAAPLDLHHHGGAARVDGVFHQLLDHAGRPLHHLASGDQLGDMAVQLLNVRHTLPPIPPATDGYTPGPTPAPAAR